MIESFPVKGLAADALPDPAPALVHASPVLLMLVALLDVLLSLRLPVIECLLDPLADAWGGQGQDFGSLS